MYILMGLGLSNKAVVNKLKEWNKKYVIVVKKEEITRYNQEYDNVIGYEMIKYLDLSKVSYVIKSPGIPYYNEYVKYFKRKHIKVINEIELTYILSKRM